MVWPLPGGPGALVVEEYANQLAGAFSDETTVTVYLCSDNSLRPVWRRIKTSRAFRPDDTGGPSGYWLRQDETATIGFTPPAASPFPAAWPVRFSEPYFGREYHA